MRRLIFSILVLMLCAPLAAQTDRVFTDDLGVSYAVERYLVANYPVALAFAPDGRLFYTEKNTGSVRVVAPDGTRQVEPVITLPTSAIAERGLLGIALDPDYETNGYIWVAHIAEATARDFASNNIVRFTEQDGVGSDPQVMFAAPITNNALIHMGGNLRFDPDGYLYFSIGDNEIPANSQDLSTPQGAIHRFAVVYDELVPAPGNPFEDSSIYAYGLRNPFDFTIDTTGERLRIFATDNGDQCDDKVNLILPGFNYGMGPGYTCGGTAADIDLTYYQPPLVSFTPSEAPTGIVVYDHEAVPEWHGELFFCAWNSGLIRRMTLNDSRNRMESMTEMDTGGVQCRVGLAVGPEGGLYFSMVGAEGGAIYRLLPQTAG